MLDHPAVFSSRDIIIGRCYQQGSSKKLDWGKDFSNVKWMNSGLNCFFCIEWWWCFLGSIFFRSNCNFTQGKGFCELLFCFDSSLSIYSIPPMIKQSGKISFQIKILVDSMQRVGHNIDRTEEVEIMKRKKTYQGERHQWVRISHKIPTKIDLVWGNW